MTIKKYLKNLSDKPFLDLYLEGKRKRKEIIKRDSGIVLQTINLAEKYEAEYEGTLKGRENDETPKEIFDFVEKEYRSRLNKNPARILKLKKELENELFFEKL